ncbi:MAG: protease complex subunit PrcB family protein [Lachnospiraceae bacterium]|nr:protease complex subunit PrcB family protein [Lachnospiraceae bacterium]MDE7200511.1 protease complex subunit PrcB family protein [Lachnospiraceae bacterium]
MDIFMDFMHLMKKGKRKLVLTMLTVFLILGTLGCSAEDEIPEDKIKDIDFTVVGEDQQPDSLKDIIAEKYTDPFQISYTLGEDLYIAVGYGEQPSGGYSISVNAFYETEDTLVIDTTLIGPGKAENVTKTPTRPYIVVKTKNIADKMIEFK